MNIPDNIMQAVDGLLAPYGGRAALSGVQCHEPRWMRQVDAAKYFCVSRPTMHTMVVSGKVKACKLDKAVLVDVNSLATQQAKEQ